MDSIWQRIETWLAASAPEILAGLNPGATEQAIADAEAYLGVRFPDDVRAIYRRHDGQAFDSPWLLYGWEWLSLERMRDEWRVWKDLLDDGEFADAQSDGDGETVRTNWWHPGWIPLTYDGAGDHHCIDLAPGPRGRAGQIIEMWHDEPARRVVASNVGEWLSRFADALENGDYVFAAADAALLHKDDL